jgi:hypothetical protein
MKTNAEAITESELAKHALTLSDAGRHAVLPYLAENLQVRHDDQGQLNVTIVAEDGSEIAPEAFFANWRERYPGYYASIIQAAPKPAPEPKTLTGRMMATIAASRSDDGKATRAAEIASGGNPWATAKRNLSKQGLIANLDADLAGRLKREAGVGT